MSNEPQSPPPGGVRVPAPETPPPGGFYPVSFEVDYPGQLNRLTTAFRLILLLPALLVAWALGGLSQGANAAGWMAVFVTRRYPRWLFAAGLSYQNWAARFAAYGLLLTDRYPSFDTTPETPVHLEIEVPPEGLSRWRVLFWKALLLVPMFVVMVVLMLAVMVVVVIAWFAILFTGRYPLGFFNFVVGYMRWGFRMSAYFYSYTDRFPPFAFAPRTGAAGNGTVVASGVVGGLLGVGAIAGVITLAVIASNPKTVDTDYQALLNGIPSDILVYDSLGDEEHQVFLASAEDPATRFDGVLRAETDERVIVFTWVIAAIEGDTGVRDDAATLKARVDGDNEEFDAQLIIVNGRGDSEEIEEGDAVEVVAAFFVPQDAEPSSVTFKPDFASFRGIKYDFEAD